MTKGKGWLEVSLVFTAQGWIKWRNQILRLIMVCDFIRDLDNFCGSQSTSLHWRKL